MKNSLPFLDPQDASKGVKTFSEGVSLFSNQTYIPASICVPCSFQFVYFVQN